MQIFAIDPGNEYSAYAVLDEWPNEDYHLLEFGKYPNKECMEKMLDWLGRRYGPDCVVIERVAGMGMTAGRELFETAEWYGRFAQEAERFVPVNYVYRREEKLTICGDSKAKDANIRQALIDRFAKHDFKNGKGTKKEPDYFYGVAADMWAAISVGVTFLDRENEKAVKEMQRCSKV